MKSWIPRVVILFALVGLVLVGAGLVGCQGFGQGFRDEGARQAAELAGAAVDAKLGDDFRELKDGLRDLPGKIPGAPADDPVKETAGYAIGALVAYVLGSAGKGYIRGKLEKKGG